MSENDAQVNIKLAQETLNEWDRYIKEESGFTSRSEFVRFAVNREVAHQREPNKDFGGNETLLREIRDSVDTLSERVGSIENQVDTLQSAVRSDPAVEELANEIFGLLPEEKPGTPEWRKKRESLQNQAQAEPNVVSKKKASAWEGNPESLARAFDVPERKIHSAIDLLITETHLVRTEETGDGKTRYWTEV